MTKISMLIILLCFVVLQFVNKRKFVINILPNKKKLFKKLDLELK